MPAEVRSRLVLLVLLAVSGVGLALLGTAVGATEPLSPAGAAFTVSDENVTFERGDERATVLEDVRAVDRIEITRRDGGTYAVDTETERALSDRERALARTVARENATIARAIVDPATYDVTVDPIRQLDTDHLETSPVEAGNDTKTAEFTVEADGNRTVTVRNVDGTVAIDRTPTYVEEEAAVRFNDPATGDPRYTAVVDLANETVVDVTDWEE